MKFDPTKIHILCCHTLPGVSIDHFTPTGLATPTENLQRAVTYLTPGAVIRDYSGDLISFIRQMIDVGVFPHDLFRVYYDDQVSFFDAEGCLTNWRYGYFYVDFNEIKL